MLKKRSDKNGMQMTMPVKVKICGITNSKDATSAALLGASYLGLIFAESSSRRINVQRAEEIGTSVAGACPLVGVFQDAALSDALKTVEQAHLDLVQLHGLESAQYCSQFTVPVIKVFSLDFTSQIDPREFLNDYLDCCDFVMFDKPKGLIAPDWLDRAVRALEKVEQDLPPYFLAGGLSPLNLKMVLNLLHPYCVDVVSGVESEVGRKDTKLVKDFCDAALGTNRSVIGKEGGLI
jgi:phosphoribosylanthranilate isomerase